jgi:alpha-beta hydrolase superfamily lysophospholipase
MKSLKSLIIITSILWSINSLSAQSPVNKNILQGSWLGKLSVSGIDLRMVFNLKINEKDSLIATMDSPDQGAKNIPLGRVIVIDEKLIIQAPLLAGEYKGTIINDTTINGTWTQRGAGYPLNINKLKTTFFLNRPQEPKPKFPYVSEDVTFINTKANIKLAGTLTLPGGDGPFTAAILITGSGGQNRDEELLGHKPFLVISDWLTRQGIAVLRFDDRGIGKSQGSQLNATSADFGSDVEAAFNFLKSNAKINPAAIGLIGHSEGGLIAPIVASSNPGIAFIVSLAGPGVTGQQIIIRQSQDISRLSGISEEQIRKSTETNKKLYAVLRKEKDNKKAEVKIIAIYKETLEKDKASKEDTEKAVNQLKATFGVSIYTWFRYFIVTDPAIFWKKVKCPVLALNGEKDLQVAADENLPAIEKAVKSSGNSSVKTIKLPGLNHLFQLCNKGLPAEYGEIEQTFSPGALQIISDWILGLKVSR